MILSAIASTSLTICEVMIISFPFVFSSRILFFTISLEKATIIVSALNPVDLARILILLKLDVSALMGYTGATLQQFFGSAFGMLFSMGFLLLWAVMPTLLALRVFNRKNF